MTDKPQSLDIPAEAKASTVVPIRAEVKLVDSNWCVYLPDGYVFSSIYKDEAYRLAGKLNLGFFAAAKAGAEMAMEEHNLEPTEKVYRKNGWTKTSDQIAEAVTRKAKDAIN